MEKKEYQEHLNKTAKQYSEDIIVVVKPTLEISLSDIQQEARYVQRSNHIGNDYPSNQAFVNSVNNAEFVLYDRTTAVDRNYYPWMLKKAGQSYLIGDNSQPDQLSPFFKPNREFFDLLQDLPEELHGAKTPAHLHYLSQKMLHPKTLTYSEWLLQNGETVTEIVEILSHGNYELFNRSLDSNGQVRRRYGNPPKPGKQITDAAECLRDAVVYGDQHSLEGALIHTNILNIYLDIATEAAKSENQREINGEIWGYVLHGSGPDMIKYVKGLTEDLSTMHQTLVTAGFPVPKKVYFGIVPTADLKLALPEPYQSDLDELVTLVKDLNQIRKAQYESSLGNNKEDKESANKKLQILNRRMGELLYETAIASIDLSEGFSTHLSQYDVLEEGPIVLPQQLKTMPFESLHNWNNKLLQIRGGLKNYAI